jgi:hypothetical protein
MFKRISRILNRIMISKKGKRMNSSGPALGPRPQPIAIAACYAQPTEMVAWALASGPACGRNQPSRRRRARWAWLERPLLARRRGQQLLAKR